MWSQAREMARRRKVETAPGLSPERKPKQLVLD